MGSELLTVSRQTGACAPKPALPQVRVLQYASYAASISGLTSNAAWNAAVAVLPRSTVALSGMLPPPVLP